MQSISDTRERHIDNLVLDGLEVDLHVAHLRIADLEADAVWHRLIAQTSMAMLQRLTHMVDRLRDERRENRATIQELQQELREAYQAMPTEFTETEPDDHADVH